jgi:hypothetical protein
MPAWAFVPFFLSCKYEKKSPVKKEKKRKEKKRNEKQKKEN